MTVSIKKVSTLALLFGTPLTLLGFLLASLFKHSVDAIAMIGLLLVLPGGFLSQQRESLSDLEFWIAFIAMQFLYYFLIVFVIMLFKARNSRPGTPLPN